jgi:DNA-directed RNA polymerase subunit RPC12/RpoP
MFRMLDTRGLVIGELAVRDRLISRDQLDGVVADQAKAGFKQPLGSLMLEKKLLSRDQLDSLLKRQKEVLADYEKALSVSGLFGRIAIEVGLITERQLNEAIRRQLELDFEGKHTKIGQILLSMKAISPSGFWEVLRAQGTFRCGDCGHTLDQPRFEKSAIHCEKCGKPALSLDEG